MAAPVLTSNSPTPGYISWTAFSLQYLGKGFDFPAGSTNYKYTYWQYNNANGTPLQFTNDPNVIAALTDDDCLLFLNKSGTSVNALTATMLDGDLIVPGSILVDQIAANSLDASVIKVGGVDVQSLAMNVTSGGGYNNVIPDPDFTDSSRRTERMNASPGGWQFVNIPQLTSANVSTSGQSLGSTSGFSAGTGWTLAYTSGQVHAQKAAAFTAGEVIAYTTDKFSVTPNRPHTARTDCTYNGGYLMKARIRWYGSNGTLISSSDGAATDVFNSNGQVYCTAFPPTGATQADMALVFSSGPSTPTTIDLPLGRSQTDGWYFWADDSHSSWNSWRLELPSVSSAQPIPLATGIPVPRGTILYFEAMLAQQYHDGLGLSLVLHHADGTTSAAGMTNHEVYMSSSGNSAANPATSTSYAHAHLLDFPIDEDGLTVDVVVDVSSPSSNPAAYARIYGAGFGQVGHNDANTNRQTTNAPTQIKSVDESGSLQLGLGAGDSINVWGNNIVRQNLAISGVSGVFPSTTTNHDENAMVNMFTGGFGIYDYSGLGANVSGIELLPRRDVPNVVPGKSGQTRDSSGLLIFSWAGPNGNDASAELHLEGASTSDLTIKSPGSLTLSSTTMEVTGAATLDSTLSVTGQASFGTTAVLTGEAWHDVGASGQPAFQNSWTTYHDASYQPSFRKLPNGDVIFKGTMAGGGNGTVAFTLPAGYRPPANTTLLTIGNLSTGVGAARVDVGPTGTVTVYATLASSGGWLALPSLRFSTLT